MKKVKKIPKFKDDVDERIFWQDHDSVDYIDWQDATPAQFPNVRPSTKTISLRLPEGLLNEIKILANKEDVPYQSFMKLLLAKSIAKKRTK